MNAVGKGYSVYVIALAADALADRDRVDLGTGAVYVGYTSKTPEERLLSHQAAGPTAGRVFKRMKDPFASTFQSDLAPYAGPYATEWEARRNERRTHNRLKSRGYKVFGDRGRKLTITKRLEPWS